MARPERRLAERNRIEEPRLGTVLRLSRGSIRGIVCGEREDHERGRSSGEGLKVWMRLEGMGRKRLDSSSLGWVDLQCHAHAVGVATPLMRDTQDLLG